MREMGQVHLRTRVLLPLALCALLLPATAQASQFPTKRIAQTRAELRDYWTPQRMAAARPASVLVEEIDSESLPPAPGERGKPLSVVGEAGAAELGSSPSRRAAQQIIDPSQSPYRTHGKVFLTFDDGNPLTSDDFVCSGTVVASKIKRLVVTAGHCVYDALATSGSPYATNWMFVPAYKDGSAPYGRWTAKNLATTRQWAKSTQDSSFENDDFRYDVGFATMRKRNGRRLQKVVGARGIAFSLERDLFFSAFGYPAAPPFDGEQLHVCNSPAQGTDSELSSPRPTRIECDMTAGASGGGWMIGRGRVNSVTSYGYECTPGDITCELFGHPEEGKLFGPYFGETIKALWRSQRKRRR